MTKILVIDSEIESRNIFLKCLKEQGFDSIGAENGLVGVQWAQQHLPDLIISEIMMPELDGYSVLAALRQNAITATIPLIFVTNKATRFDIRKGMDFGADDYLIKPCTVEELLGSIIARLEKQTFFKQCYAAELQQVLKPTKVNKLPRVNAAVFKSQVNLFQESAESIQQNLETFPHGVMKLAATKSIFPSIDSLNDIFNFIEAHYHQPISLRDVAQSVGYSAAYLTDLVRRKTGQSVHRWITRRRMVAACSLLLETDQSIDCIASSVGYCYTWCFFRHFRSSFGMTPGDWRSANRGSVGKTCGDIA
jgi:YesN/AraC family two-component response regulator